MAAPDTPLQAEHVDAAEYGSVGMVKKEEVSSLSCKASKQSTWEKEYANPWMLLLNALAVIGYQIISMFMVAYQVLWRQHYIMRCVRPLATWQIWSCEYTKAYTRFFPLVAILISMSLVRSMILIQRMYYQLLHHGAILKFKEYKATKEPIFYVLTICLLHAASNYALDKLTQGKVTEHFQALDWANSTAQTFELVEGTRGWFVYLVIPIGAFICSLYFAHEPAYNLVPLSRYVHGESILDEEMAQQSLKELVSIQEDHVQAICEHWEIYPCTTAEEAGKAYKDLISIAKDFRDSGAVIVGKQHLTKRLMQSQITDRFWPAKFLFQPGLQDEESVLFKRVSRSYDMCCVAAATCCMWLFLDCGWNDVLDVASGQVEDLSALLVEAAHVAFALFYIAQILRTAC